MLIPPAPFRQRPMTVDDVDAVMAVDRLAFAAPWKATGYQYEVSENANAYYRVLLVVEEGRERLIGYTGHWLLADELHVSTIAIHPHWRRRGLGELLLLNTLFAGYEQAARLATLEVRRSNEAAQALYRRYRFVQTGVRRNYYRDNREDALIMTVDPLDAGYHTFLTEQKVALAARLAAEFTSATPDRA